MRHSTSFDDIPLVVQKNGGGIRAFCSRQKRVIIVVFIVAIVISVAVVLGSVLYESKHKEKPSCAEAAHKIIEAAMSDSSLAYSRLGYMCNTFGNRLSGSNSLELALDWILAEMQRDNLSNIEADPVDVPRWIRGDEWCSISSPTLNKTLAILGLGGSANTSGNVLTAEVLVVTSFTDLQNKSAQVPGKIVLFNVPFTAYGITVAYRSSGAVEAAKLGAVGALMRSVTPYSLYTPHTGSTTPTTIPFAAVTVEDAMQIQALVNYGQVVTVSLYMESHFLSDFTSRNIMGEVTGSLYPQKVVAIGGHTDSWDVGQGAMDDGGGVLVAWEAVRLLKSLGLTPKRTVRFVGWVNEENGLRGGTAYAQMHGNETHMLAIESDGGATTPYGLQVYATQKDYDYLSNVAPLLSSVGADSILGIVKSTSGGADIGPLQNLGVPVAALWTDMSQYFYFHHSNADTFDKMDDLQMRKCVATMAVNAYCVADAEDDFQLTKQVNSTRR